MSVNRDGFSMLHCIFIGRHEMTVISRQAPRPLPFELPAYRVGVRVVKGV